MKNVLAILQVLVGLFPMVLAAIKEFENSEATGAQKKVAVLQVIGAILAQFRNLKQDVIDGAMGLLDKLIDAVVAGYNLLGIFKKKDQAADAVDVTAGAG